LGHISSGFCVILIGRGTSAKFRQKKELSDSTDREKEGGDKKKKKKKKRKTPSQSLSPREGKEILREQKERPGRDRIRGKRSFGNRALRLKKKPQMIEREKRILPHGEKRGKEEFPWESRI